MRIALNTVGVIVLLSAAVAAVRTTHPSIVSSACSASLMISSSSMIRTCAGEWDINYASASELPVRATGRVNVNRVPCPTTLSQDSVPMCSCTMP